MDQEEAILGIPRSASDLDEQRALNNPFLKNLLDKMLEEKLKQVGLTATGTNRNDPQPSCSSKLTDAEKGQSNIDKIQKKLDVNQKNTAVMNVHRLKSPSDTTIYRPALNKREQCRPKQMGFDQIPNSQTQSPCLAAKRIDGQLIDVVKDVNTIEVINTNQPMPQLNIVSDFVDSMRRKHDERQVGSEVSVPGLDDARQGQNMLCWKPKSSEQLLPNRKVNNFNHNCHHLEIIGITM